MVESYLRQTRHAVVARSRAAASSRRARAVDATIPVQPVEISSHGRGHRKRIANAGLVAHLWVVRLGRRTLGVRLVNGHRRRAGAGRWDGVLQVSAAGLAS